MPDKEIYTIKNLLNINHQVDRIYQVDLSNSQVLVGDSVEKLIYNRK